MRYDAQRKPDFSMPKLCGACAHYRQHYILDERNQFKAIWYGHCSSGEIRVPSDHCPDWENVTKVIHPPKPW